MAESKKELKSLLMKVKEESEKASLKLNIQKIKIMASGPITSWQIDGETMETVTDIFWAPKSLQMVTAAMKLKDTCSLEEKLWPRHRQHIRHIRQHIRQHIKKQRHYFANKGLSSQGYGFSSGHVWMWQLNYKESWVLKNWYFWTVVLKKTLEGPLDSKEINQSIIKKISPEYSLEKLMLKLKLQYFGNLLEELIHLKRPWSWERLKAGGKGDGRGWDGWMASLTQWTWVWVSSGSWCLNGRSGVLQSMESQRIGHDCVTELNWTEIWIFKEFIEYITQKYRAKEWTNYFHTYKHE